MPNDREKEVVLFARGSQDGDSTADDWDDTELLKEYDRAVRPLKSLVAERMGLSNATLEEVSGSESCTSSRTAVEKSIHNNQKRYQRKRRRKGKNKQHREWAVGDHCQAKFSVDNKWYEATIISIDKEQSKCEVQYVGYGNVEEQSVHAISHSMGAALRRQQVKIAALDKVVDGEVNPSDDGVDCTSQAGSNVSQSKGQSSVRRNKHSALNRSEEATSNHLPRGPEASHSLNSNIFSGHSIPNFAGIASHPMMQDMVPPPLPPHVLSGLPSDDSEALSAMLMSWYMSGFHTGYYQGLKRAKSCSPSHHS